MSLVTYDFSDSDEEIEDDSETSTKPQNDVNQILKKANDISISEHKSASGNVNGVKDDDDYLEKSDCTAVPMFSILPKPKDLTDLIDKQVEEDENIPPAKELKFTETKPVKERTRVQITIPSLSEFKDVEESKKKKHVQPLSMKTSSLFSLLPLPKSQTASKTLIPQILKKKPSESKPQPIKNPVKPSLNKLKLQSVNKTSTLLGSTYDSESEDEEEASRLTSSSAAKLDFFSLTSSKDELPNVDIEQIQKETEEMTAKYLLKQENSVSNEEYPTPAYQFEDVQPGSSSSTSSFDLHKQDIIIKNKIEVGPKLPVPEQDYNLDSQGNLAFDNKAMEYLCGKRGMKRKNEEFDAANVIEINGEDIKPDEREWLVKALTENPIHRPVSLGVGPGGQSKKKHQITYLAHQAKAMELELQNQWAQNRMTRQQTQSKYGF